MKPAHFAPTSALMRGLRTTAIAGAVVFAAGLYWAPERAWAAFLVAFLVFTGLALCGPFFTALLVLSKARWPGELRWIAESTLSALLVAAFLGMVLIGGVHTLYEWSHPAAVAADALLAHKAPYLNWGGFSARMAAYFVAWIWLASRLTQAVRALRSSPGVEASRRVTRAAALFTAVFAVTFSLASVDWVQSLAPHWFSTMFALVVLSTVALAALAAFILLADAIDSRLRRALFLTTDRVDDLGRILIGLSLFWAYIGYCQHALIWYTNMPEETSWYEARSGPEWVIVSRAALVLCWLLPFTALMPRKLRRSRKVLTRAALAVLVGSAVHVYYLIAPAVTGPTPSDGALEIVLVVAALAAFAWCVLRELAHRLDAAGAIAHEGLEASHSGPARELSAR